MEEQTTIYDSLMELPLFLGHSREDLATILKNIQKEFRSFRKGRVIVSQEDPCRHIVLLMEGDVSLSRTSLHKDLVFTEHFHAPNSIGTETVFGLRQNFSHTITALGDVKALMLSKQNIIDHLFSYEVFRYNMLNMLTTRIQRSNQMLWAPDEGDTTHRFVALMKRNFLYHGGTKQIDGGMVALARMMNETRARVSAMLNTLQAQGLITLSRNRITIPHLEELIQQA